MKIGYCEHWYANLHSLIQTLSAATLPKKDIIREYQKPKSILFKLN